MENKLALWGDSFAKVNSPDIKIAVPLDVGGPSVSDPGGANLALLAGLFEVGVVAVYARGGLDSKEKLSNGPYFYLPHDAVIQGLPQVASFLTQASKAVSVAYEGTVDAQNRATGDKPMTPAKAAEWVIGKLKDR